MTIVVFVGNDGSCSNQVSLTTLGFQQKKAETGSKMY